MTKTEQQVIKGIADDLEIHLMEIEDEMVPYYLKSRLKKDLHKLQSIYDCKQPHTSLCLVENCIRHHL